MVSYVCMYCTISDGRQRWEDCEARRRVWFWIELMRNQAERFLLEGNAEMASHHGFSGASAASKVLPVSSLTATPICPF